MKKNKFVLATTAALLLASLGGIQAFAAEDGTGQMSDKTDTTVTINNDTKPIDPTDPAGTKLSLEHVPTNFDFTSTLKNKKYTIESGIITDSKRTEENVENANNIEVFNSRIEREWKVTTTIGDLTDSVTGAVIKDASMTITAGETTATTGTGANNYVFKNVDGTLSAANNTGLLSTKATAITIDFLDKDNKLKADSKLTAEVAYTLVATKDAE